MTKHKRHNSRTLDADRDTFAAAFETHNVSFETPRHPTEHTLVQAYLASACISSFRSARAAHRAGTVAAVFGVRATPSRKAATGNDVIRQ
jgi:hypothetical protein